MAEAKGSLSSSKKSKKEDILELITPDLALSVLRFLAKEDKNIAERIRQLALEYLREVDVEDVTEGVFGDLDSIDVQNLKEMEAFVMENCPKWAR